MTTQNGKVLFFFFKTRLRVATPDPYIFTKNRGACNKTTLF